MPTYDNKVLTGDQLVYYSGLIKTALATKADSSALANKQDALVFNTAYNASTNKVATMSDIPDAFDMEDLNVGNGLSLEQEDNELYLTLDEDTVRGQIDTVIGEGIDWNNVYTNDLDEYEQSISVSSKISSMDTTIAGKQDALVFNTAYNASTNKVATMSDITTVLSGISSFSFEIVQSLPQSNISTSKIYLVAKQTSGTNQVYTEYAYVNNAWEIIGDTSMTIDTLSNSEVQSIWNAATT